MEKLVLVFTGMTSALLAESYQGDRTQRQQSVLKIAKSTVEIYSQRISAKLRCANPRTRRVSCTSKILPTSQPHKAESFFITLWA
jgi:hypothetical protein